MKRSRKKTKLSGKGDLDSVLNGYETLYNFIINLYNKSSNMDYKTKCLFEKIHTQIETYKKIINKKLSLPEILFAKVELLKKYMIVYYIYYAGINKGNEALKRILNETKLVNIKDIKEEIADIILKEKSC